MEEYTSHPIIPDVTDVSAEDDFILGVKFEDGVERKFDVKPYLNWKCYTQLNNEEFFKLASVNYGTVVWPGEIDIDPELLYCG
jgi:Protein of unknown function (DUF2442).